MESAHIGKGIAKFEETFINTLGTSGAKLMLNRNISTMLAYAIPAGVDGAPEARVLNLMGWVNLQPDERALLR